MTIQQQFKKYWWWISIWFWSIAAVWVRITSNESKSSQALFGSVRLFGSGGFVLHATGNRRNFIGLTGTFRRFRRAFSWVITCSDLFLINNWGFLFHQWSQGSFTRRQTSHASLPGLGFLRFQNTIVPTSVILQRVNQPLVKKRKWSNRSSTNQNKHPVNICRRLGFLWLHFVQLQFASGEMELLEGNKREVCRLLPRSLLRHSSSRQQAGWLSGRTCATRVSVHQERSQMRRF